MYSNFLAPFVGNGTIFKIPSEIKLPLSISFVRITYNPVAVFGCCFNSLKATTKQRILKVWNRAVALLLYLPVPAVFLLWIYANCKIASAFPVRLNFTWWIGWSQFWRHIIISMHRRFHEMFVELSLYLTKPKDLRNFSWKRRTSKIRMLLQKCSPLILWAVWNVANG